jgi:hypothetical protein
MLIVEACAAQTSMSTRKLTGLVPSCVRRTGIMTLAIDNADATSSSCAAWSDATLEVCPKIHVK